MGFGCSVPAIMGARTMENEKDRRMTILLIPFHVLLRQAAGVRPAVGRLLRPLGRAGGVRAVRHRHGGGHPLGHSLQAHPLFRGAAPFVLELPPYRFPSMENIATHVWQKVKGFR